MIRNLRDHGRGRAAVVLPLRWQLFLFLVVASQSLQTRLDENQAEFRVGVFAVFLEVLANVDSFADEVMQILRESGSEAFDLQDAKNLGVGDGLHAGNTVGITEHHADLRRSHALLRIGYNIAGNLCRLGVAPFWRRATVRQRRACHTFAI